MVYSIYAVLFGIGQYFFSGATLLFVFYVKLCYVCNLYYTKVTHMDTISVLLKCKYCIYYLGKSCLGQRGVYGVFHHYENMPMQYTI